MPNSLCPACLQPDAGLSVCPQCGWYPDTQVDTLYLSPGTIVKPPYQVARVLGHGGFGITYLGWDATLQIKVAIKEYLPREFVSRDPGSAKVYADTEQSQRHFLAGLNSFLDEARTLAKFQQHPGIVSVLAFFQAFGTGYMVMEYVEGETLKSYLQQRGRLGWTQTLDIFMQIMDALRAVHTAGLLHRDIAPDNIYLCGDGRIKLLDFGAAQVSHGNGDQYKRSLEVMIKPGFAPEEQYRDSQQQGPWSDVYSVAASMYFCLTGQAPPEAIDRLHQDRLKPPSEHGVIMPSAAEQALMAALAVSSLQRPQSMESLQQQFLSLPSPIISSPISRPDNLSINKPTSRFSLPTADGNSQHLHWQRWLLMAGLVIFIVWFVFYLAEDKVATPVSEPISSHVSETFPPAKIDKTYLSDAESMARQRELERQAAEELKQQQAAALKRFEERNRLESTPMSDTSKQPDSRHLEHLRSLCDEWGATMECRGLK